VGSDQSWRFERKPTLEGKGYFIVMTIIEKLQACTLYLILILVSYMSLLSCSPRGGPAWQDSRKADFGFIACPA